MRLRTMHKRRRRKERKRIVRRQIRYHFGVANLSLSHMTLTMRNLTDSVHVMTSGLECLSASINGEIDITPEELEEFLFGNPYGPLTDEYLS